MGTISKIRDAFAALLAIATSLIVAGALVAFFVTLLLAASEHGFVVEALSVPKDLADQGYSGQVVASQIVDRMSAMQMATGNAGPKSKKTLSVVPPDVPMKIQLSQDGISVGEFYGQLRSWLSDTTFVTGELVVLPNGVRAIMRSSDRKITCAKFVWFEWHSPGKLDLDPLVEQLARCIYLKAEPYRFARFVELEGNLRYAKQLYGEITAKGARSERPWARFSIAEVLGKEGDDTNGRLQAYRRAIHDLPNFALAYRALARLETDIGDDRAARADSAALLFVLHRGHSADTDDDTATQLIAEYRGHFAEADGDYAAAIAYSRQAEGLAAHEDYLLSIYADEIRNLAAHHDSHDLVVALKRYIDLPHHARLDICGFLAAALKIGHRDVAFDSCPATWRPTWRAWRAINAMASNALPAADDLLKGTPGRCYRCLIAKGMLAERRDRPGEADDFLGKAIQLAPSLPFAHIEYARILLARGALAHAESEIRKAARLGARLAEPLMLWGDIAARRGDLDLAVEKYLAAKQRAPNWTELRAQLAGALERLGRTKDAGEQRGDALRLAIADNEAARLLHDAAAEDNAEALFDKDPRQAAAPLADLMSRWTWSGRVPLLLGKAHEVLGDKAGACSAFAAAVRRYAPLLESGLNGLEIFYVQQAQLETIGKDRLANLAWTRQAPNLSRAAFEGSNACERPRSSAG